MIGSVSCLGVREASFGIWQKTCRGLRKNMQWLSGKHAEVLSKTCRGFGKTCRGLLSFMPRERKCILQFSFFPSVPMKKNGFFSFSSSFVPFRGTTGMRCSPMLVYQRLEPFFFFRDMCPLSVFCAFFFTFLVVHAIFLV